MKAVFLFVIFIIFILGGILWLKFSTRIKKGTFVCETKGNNKRIIKTDYGTFMIDGHEQKLDWKTPNGEIKSLAFDDIKGINFSYNETSAFLDSFCSESPPEYQDKNTTYLISLVLNNQGSQFNHDKIPLFVAQQYEIREDMDIPVNRFLLQALSLYKDAGAYSRGVLEKIIYIFKRSGKKLNLI